MAGYAQELPAYGGGLEPWLRSTCETAHRLNTAVGSGFWELASRSDLPPDLADVERSRRHRRRQTSTHVARVLWRACGGDGNPPEELQVTVDIHLSAHFTAAAVEAGQDWQHASERAYRAILTAVSELRDRPS